MSTTGVYFLYFCRPFTNLLTPFCFRWCYWLGRVVLSIQKNNKKSTTHYKLKITKNNTVHDIFYYRICVFVYVLTPSSNNNNSVIPLVEFSCLIPKKLDLYLFIYCHIFVIFDEIFKLGWFKGNLIEVPFSNLFT